MTGQYIPKTLNLAQKQGWSEPGKKSPPLHKILETASKTLETQNGLAVHRLYFCLWDKVTAPWIII